MTTTAAPLARRAPDTLTAPPQPADQHPVAVYLGRLAPGSRRTMRQALNTIASLLTNGHHDAIALDWATLRYQHTTVVRPMLAERYAPATANKMLAALRGTLKEAWRLGQLDAERYHRAVDLPAVRGTRLPRGRALSSGELRALFAVCAADHSPAGARDAALLAVLYGTGLRRSEAVALDLADYQLETGALTTRSGKGNQARVGYARGGAQAALAAWLRWRGTAEGPLFWPINKAGRLTQRRLTDQAVLVILRKRAAQAGVAPFSPHDLRRSFISHLLDAGADISTVQQLAGHANVGTTARYDRRGEANKREAAGLLHIPYLAAA
ncbi:MAG: integrase [Planctomycetes bacterium]|nr:integrase [Planctomycetota bacterium]